MSAYRGIFSRSVVALLCGGFSDGAKLTHKYAGRCTQGSASLSPFQRQSDAEMGLLHVKITSNSSQLGENHFLG